MNRLTMVVGIVAVALGVLGGWLGSGLWSGHAQRQAEEPESARLERQLEDLRTENDRMGTLLNTAQRQIETTQADLRREREMNARLHVLLSDGRK